MACSKLYSYWTKHRDITSNVDSFVYEVDEAADGAMAYDFQTDENQICCSPGMTSLTCEESTVDCHTDSNMECEVNAHSSIEQCDECDFYVDYGISPEGGDDDFDFFSPCDTATDHSDDDEDEDQCDEKLSLLLSQWATNFRIPLNAVGNLLHILHIFHPDLPLDPNALLHSLRKVPVKDMSDGGTYYHFGIATNLEKKFQSCPTDSCFNDDILQIQINIDGLPISKSTSLQLWPILGILKGASNEDPFTIGIYAGNQKPKNVNEFVEEFVKNVKDLETVGIQLGGRKYTAAIHSFVCDAPARSMLKNTKLHCGYNACERCVQKGEWSARVIYVDTDSPLRTNVSFDELRDKDHHHGPSPLHDLNIGFVTHFVLDYMHLVCLGVMRRLISLWMRGPLTTRLSAGIIQQISQRLINLRQCMPLEFGRKPRTLLELDRWKATEFRQFLLYTGPVVLKGLLKESMYQHFMLLSFSIYCCLNPDFSAYYSDFVKRCLTLFVKLAGDIYGKEVLVYNMHSLVHIVDDVMMFGSLETVSCFPFENHLGCIKKLIRRPGKPLQQIVCRLFENNAVKSACGQDAVHLVDNVHTDGPVSYDLKATNAKFTEYRKLNIKHCTIKASMKDGTILLNNGEIALVSNIVCNGTEISVVCQRYLHQRPLYKYPLSSSDICMVIVGQLSPRYESVSYKSVAKKCVCIAIKDKKEFAVLPFAHKM